MMDQQAAIITEREDLDRAWVRGGIIWALAVAVILLSLGDTVASMVATWWNSASYNHCFLIPIISVYLVWERRTLFDHVVPESSWWGVVGVAGAALLWTMGRIGGAMVVEQFALVFMIQASVLAFFGWRAFRALILPVAFLLFAVPFGEFLVKPLQDFTAVFVVHALRLIDIPVFMDGVFLSTPSGDFHVAEACSGVRFLIATVPLGVLFADLAFKSWYRRAMVVLLSILVPIIANGIRAFGIVYIAYLTDNEYATGVDHLVYGWIFFTIVIFLLIGIGMMFADKPVGEPSFRIPDHDDMTPPATVGRFGAVAVAILVLANAGPLLNARTMKAIGDYTVPDLAAPVVNGPWQIAPTPDAPPWKPHFRGIDAELVQDYTRADGARVTLYYGYYGAQRERAQLVQFGNTVAAPDYWDWSSIRNVEARYGDQAKTVVESRIITRRQTRLVWHWYWSGGFISANPYLVKVMDLSAKILGGETAASVVAVSVERGFTDEEARNVLADFLEHVAPGLPGIPGGNR